MKLKIFSANIKLFSYFIGLSVLGSVLLCLPISYSETVKIQYVDALFTSVSAVCVTGLSTVPMSIYSRFGKIVILLLIEFGGLGIITFIAFYLAVPTKKISSMNRKMVKEYFIDDVEVNPREILKRIISYTLIVQIVCGLSLLVPLKVSGKTSFIFDSFFLSISAFCNAGFSPYVDSLSSVQNNPCVMIPIMLSIIIGGIGFTVIQNIIQVIKTKNKKDKKHLSLHTKIVLVVNAFLLVIGVVVFFISEYSSSFKGLSFPQKVMASFFQSVTVRTAGFETIPQGSLSIITELFSVFLMFIGGSSGSIAGGVKTTTFFIAVLYAMDGDTEKNNIRLGNRTVDSSIVNKSVTIITRSLIILSFSIFLLVITEKSMLAIGNISLTDLVFEAVSAFATVGLSQGITSNLSICGKIVIILTMFVGRTGIFAMSLRLSRKQSLPSVVEYPNDQVLVG